MCSNTGKAIRMKRVFDENGISIILGVSHHMTSNKIIPGQIDVCAKITAAVNGGATGICIGKGFLKKCIKAIKSNTGVLIYVPAYPPFSKINPYKLTITSTVEDILSLGGDAAILTVDYYTEDAAQYSIEQTAYFAKECDKYGIVLIVETEFPSFYEKNIDNIKKYGLNYLKIAARMASELGADVITTSYTGDEDSFSELVDFAKIPVLINGGTTIDQFEFLKMIETVNKAGAKGCLIGRNITEVPDSEKMTRAIGTIFRKNITAKEALELLK